MSTCWHCVRWLILNRRVSMPCGGRTSFLLRKSPSRLMSPMRCVNALSRADFISTQCGRPRPQRWICVNALRRADFISTRSVEAAEDGEITGVNALSRADFISTFSGSWLPAAIVMMCQCPKSGGLHFYTKKTSSRSRSRRYVSMPLVGRTSFLRKNDYLA